jgi:5'(3')-deoxyribonucleotidase
MQKRLIVDMDDVMADASGAIIKIYNEEFGTSYTHEHFNGTSLWDNNFKNNYLQIRHRLHEVGFFRNMTVKNDAVEVMKALYQKYEVYIVSAATEFPNSLKEKIDWLGQHFDFIPWQRVVLCGDKQIVTGDIMIDDHDKNLRHFKGQTILFDAIHNQSFENYERVKNWREVAGVLL